MEKLWTTTEAAQYLGLTESELGQLVQEGQLTGYKLGGKFLRFRPDQVKALKPTLPAAPPAPARAQGGPGERPSWRARLHDFVYFYDLYLVSGAMLAMLVVYLVASG
ncbi:MAG: helix-turn-helix domain-containing protein [Candidatus Omnitrophica bacterium]|nr:helix-turn-helix domain-containing protein [Candidatus Omnitrophota bacterium]